MIFKTVKISFLVLLPLILTSNIKVNGSTDETVLVKGKYKLYATGALNKELNGLVHFETAVETSGKGIALSILKLNLDNEEGTAQHSIGFLISKQNESKVIPVGKYDVSKNIDGFFNSFEGVFGFANIKALGETPFFANNGKIVITQMGDMGLYGKMDVILINTDGKQIKIEGNFNAVKGN